MERELQFRREIATNNLQGEELEARKNKHRAEIEELKKHKGHQPGGRQQLEEVWKDEDGLAEMDFDPHVFFSMHDVTADGFLDVKELEALFWKEASELHTVDGVLDDMMAREEVAIMYGSPAAPQSDLGRY